MEHHRRRGKTFTTDPISKRRLKNFGEEEKYYIENHHEPIVSREVWDAAQEQREKRMKVNVLPESGLRVRNTRQYAFSSKCECAFCGHKLSRRTRHSSSKYSKIVWQCMNATKYGIVNCPHCKAIDETIMEESFLEVFRLLAENFEDVLIDGIIDKETYDSKMLEFTRKLHTFNSRRNLLLGDINVQKNISNRMAELRELLGTEDVLDEFDRAAFESIVEKVYVGGYDDTGNPDPYKLTFVLKGNQQGSMPDSKVAYKERHKK